MKIIAESQPAKKAPYIHVGYIATTSLQPVSSLFSTGIVAVVIGMVLGARLVRRTPKAGWNLIFVKTTIGRIGWCLAALGLVLFLASYLLGEKVPLHPQSLTNYKMHEIARYYDSWIQTKKLTLTLPSEAGLYDIDDLSSATDASYLYPEELMKDVWSKQIKMQIPDSATSTTDIMLISAGLDQTYMTEDDITFNFSERMSTETLSILEKGI